MESWDHLLPKTSRFHCSEPPGAGQEPRPGHRAGLARGWPGLEQVLESSPRFPGVSGMLIASDMSCSSCCIPCSGCPTAVAESSMIYSARRLLRGARGLFLLLLRPSGFAADPLQRWHRGCFYPLLISARRFPPAVAFLAFCSVIRRLRNASGVP